MSETRIREKDRLAVIERAGGCCEYCGSQMRYSSDPFSVEHIIPRAMGGTDSADNLALSCQGCNNIKFTSTQAPDPISGNITPLYHPRLHRWNDHFLWHEDFTQMIGKTAIGRATIVRLQLNREGVVNLRRALHWIGEHPPALPEYSE